MNQLCEYLVVRKVPRVIIVTVYNPVPNYPLAVKAMDALNEITCQIAQQHGFVIADVFKQFKGKEADYIEGYLAGRFEDLASPIGGLFILILKVTERLSSSSLPW